MVAAGSQVRCCDRKIATEGWTAKDLQSRAVGGRIHGDESGE